MTGHLQISWTWSNNATIHYKILIILRKVRKGKTRKGKVRHENQGEDRISKASKRKETKCKQRRGMEYSFISRSGSLNQVPYKSCLNIPEWALQQKQIGTLLIDKQYNNKSDIKAAIFHTQAQLLYMSCGGRYLLCHAMLAEWWQKQKKPFITDVWMLHPYCFIMLPDDAF